MPNNAISILTLLYCCVIASSAPAAYQPNSPADTIEGNSDTIDSSLDSTAVAKKPSPFAPCRYLTTDGMNFELTESDIIDTVTDEDDDADDPSAVMLERYPRSSGIGAIISGAALASLGSLFVGAGVMSLGSDARFDPPTIAGSIMTIAGAIVVTAGIIKLHNYRRWANRYRLPQHSRSSAVPDDSLHSTVITLPPEQRSP
jgi:hypothetical protein